MIGEPIYYQAGYKYRLSRPWLVDLNIFAPFPPMPADIVAEYITLTRGGLLGIERRYNWDGCSGPTIDDTTNMRGGCAHDALYQLMRMGLLPMSYRKYADRILEAVCVADGMDDFRAWYYKAGVDLFAEKCATPGYEPYPELVAPRKEKDGELPLFDQVMAGDWRLMA